MSHDPLDLLRDHLRTEAVLLEPSLSIDEVVDRAIGEADLDGRARTPAVGPPRRWRSGAAIGLAVLVVGAGAVAATAIRRERATEPVAGVACRAGADLAASAVVVPASADPVAACAAVWAAGDLPVVDGDNRPSSPALVACVGPEGEVEVVPDDHLDTCARLGLVEVEPIPAGSALFTLQQRLVDEIGMQDCVPVDEAVRMTEQILADVGLGHWSVEVVDRDEPCGRPAVIAARDTVVVSPTPARPTD